MAMTENAKKQAVERLKKANDKLLGDKYIKVSATLRFRFDGIQLQYKFDSKEDAVAERRRIIDYLIEHKTLEGYKPTDKAKMNAYQYQNWRAKKG